MTAPEVNLDLARSTLRAEGDAILSLIDLVDSPFEQAARMIFSCSGKVILTGIGKAGIVAQKTSATLASTGTSSIFLHPVEALHGDLGRLAKGDVVIALSHSGATGAVLRLVDHIRSLGAELIALTGTPESQLAKHADITLTYGSIQEACPLGLAPTVSTACMLALGDALAICVMDMRRFREEDFARFHPGGSLAWRLMKVDDAMTFHQAEKFSVADDSLSLGKALSEAEQVSRRTGAMMLVNAEGKLSGILTDADLRRHLIQTGGDDIMNRPVSEFMTPDPKHIHLGQLASKALSILNEYRIDELPVLDDDDRPVGIIDVQDLLSMKTITSG